MAEFSDHLDLSIICLEINAKAAHALVLPAFPGSKFEGAFGQSLFELSCTMRDHHARFGCEGCPLRTVCAFGELYQPLPPEGFPARSVKTAPRPLIFITEHSEEKQLAPSEDFSFGLNLVGCAERYLPFILTALRKLGDKGIGLTRGRFAVIKVCSRHPYTGDAKTLAEQASPLLSTAAIRLGRDSLPPLPDNHHLSLEFLSMVQLRRKGQVLMAFTFEDLVRDLQRRLSNLEQLYGNAATMNLNYGELPELAREVRITDASFRHTAQVRGKNTVMHGLIGTISLSGELAPFTMLLRYGELVGAGKWASFGMGRYRLEAV